MSFDSEQEAFEAYASAMTNNCVFLVDTYDTLEGVRHAVRVGQELRRQGHEMTGIRLDSGDLAYLSIEARKILDAGGFPKAQIAKRLGISRNTVIRAVSSVEPPMYERAPGRGDVVHTVRGTRAGDADRVP